MPWHGCREARGGAGTKVRVQAKLGRAVSAGDRVEARCRGAWTEVGRRPAGSQGLGGGVEACVVGGAMVKGGSSLVNGGVRGCYHGGSCERTRRPAWSSQMDPRVLVHAEVASMRTKAGRVRGRELGQACGGVLALGGGRGSRGRVGAEALELLQWRGAQIRRWHPWQ